MTNRSDTRPLDSRNIEHDYAVIELAKDAGNDYMRFTISPDLSQFTGRIHFRWINLSCDEPWKNVRAEKKRGKLWLISAGSIIRRGWLSTSSYKHDFGANFFLFLSFRHTYLLWNYKCCSARSTCPSMTWCRIGFVSQRSRIRTWSFNSVTPNTAG